MSKAKASTSIGAGAFFCAEEIAEGLRPRVAYDTMDGLIISILYKTIHLARRPIVGKGLEAENDHHW